MNKWPQDRLPDSTMTSLVPMERLFVRQIREYVELLGVETRNKYEILDENQNPVAFAAEEETGLLGFFMRQFLGHWRTFQIHFFDSQKRCFMVAKHPFRFFFQRLEVFDHEGRFVGAIQQRFSLLTKRFDVESNNGRILMEVASPIWRIWTFVFTRRGAPLATVAKKWSGAFSEIFTDRDNFLIEYQDSQLDDSGRALILAAALFIDLQYFEKKANSRSF